MSKQRYNEQKLNEFLGSLFRAIGRSQGKKAAKLLAKDPVLKRNVAVARKAQIDTYDYLKQRLKDQGLWDGATKRQWDKDKAAALGLYDS